MQARPLVLPICAAIATIVSATARPVELGGLVENLAGRTTPGLVALKVSSRLITAAGTTGRVAMLDPRPSTGAPAVPAGREASTALTIDRFSVALAVARLEAGLLPITDF